MIQFTLLTNMIDKAIKDISGQQFVPTSGQQFVPTKEMTDLLLDIRLHLLIEEESILD
jgi:hypothetical protein